MEREIFENYQTEISRQFKRERRHEAQRLEAERLSKLPKITYIAAHPWIKKQIQQSFDSDNKFVVINHQFELGDLNFRGKLPATQELVVVLSNDARSQLLLQYIAAHFHHKISIINIDVHEEKINPFELSKKQIQALRLEFETLKNL